MYINTMDTKEGPITTEGYLLPVPHQVHSERQSAAEEED